MSIRPANRYVYAATWLLTIASLVFVIRYAQSLDFSGFAYVFDDARWAYWLLSAGFAVAHIVICGVLYSSSLGGSRERPVLPVFVVSQIAKYVPGRIWGMLMQKALIGSSVSAVQVVSANARVTATVIASQLLLLFVLAGGLGWIDPIIALGAIFLCIGSGGILAALANKTRWPILAAWQGAGNAAASAFYIIASAAATAAAWMTFYSGGLGIEWMAVLEATTISTGSFLAGLASALPAGLGTREAAFILFGNTTHLTLDVALLPALALASRLWLFASDVLCAVVGCCWLILVRRKLK